MNLVDLSQLVSSLCALAAPVLLRRLLQEATVQNVILLFFVSLVATLSGRAKDQVCRVQATFMSAMLKAGLYEKCLYMSPQSRAMYPAGTIITVSSHDVSFFRNYFLKVHDIWSSVMQIIIISLLVFWILGPSCLIGTTTLPEQDCCQG